MSQNDPKPEKEQVIPPPEKEPVPAIDIPVIDVPPLEKVDYKIIPTWEGSFDIRKNETIDVD